MFDRVRRFIAAFSFGLMMYTSAYAEMVAGNEDFIHLDKVDGIWWLVDAEGERFVVTGMNHISFTTRFAPYNKDYWLKEFGPGLFDESGYAYEAFLQRHEWHIQRFDVYVLHPWIEALVSRPGMPKAKQIWVDVLKSRYPSAAAAGAAYDVEVENWDDFAWS